MQCKKILLNKWISVFDVITLVELSLISPMRVHLPVFTQWRGGICGFNPLEVTSLLPNTRVWVNYSLVSSILMGSEWCLWHLWCGVWTLSLFGRSLTLFWTRFFGHPFGHLWLFCGLSFTDFPFTHCFSLILSNCSFDFFSVYMYTHIFIGLFYVFWCNGEQVIFG